MPAFLRWAWSLKDIQRTEHPFLRRILDRARLDVEHVSLGWMCSVLVWCPQCVRDGVHLIAHQHRAVSHCPVHGKKLQWFCGYCGMSKSYCVFAGSSIFQCKHCGHHEARPKVLSEDEMGNQVAEPEIGEPLAQSVCFPGIPNNVEILGVRGLTPQDIANLYAQQSLDPLQQSPQSQVIAKYFRFAARTVASGRNYLGHSEGVGIMMDRARTLAILSGHTCLNRGLGPIKEGSQTCPCEVGYRLWERRLHPELFAAMHEMTGIEAIEYESSHLGLCLSAAWFAASQARASGVSTSYRMLLAFLEPRAGIPGSSFADRRDLKVGVLSSDFQWFSVRCARPAQDVLRLRRQLDGMGKMGKTDSPDAVVLDAGWLAEQSLWTERARNSLHE